MIPRRIAAILWTLAVLGLHAIPRTQFEKLPGREYTLREGPDKLAHLVLFGLLSGLWILVFPRRPWLIVLAGVIYGAALELMQHFLIYGRSGNVLDFLCDIIGLFIGLAAIAGFHAWKGRRNPLVEQERPL